MEIMSLRIEQLRKERGWSQSELARRLGVKPPQTNRWESGARRPELNNLVRMCDLFDVSIDYLYGRTDVRRVAKAEEGSEEHGEVV